MSDQNQTGPARQGVTAHLVIRDAAKAIDYYKAAFGAVEFCRMPGEDGRLMHAMIGVNGSNVMLCDEYPEYGSKGPEGASSPVTLHLLCEDVDATFARAVELGAQPKMPPQDMFWGDRYGIVVDPFGHHWSLATPKRQVSMEEMMAAAREMSKVPCPEAAKMAEAAAKN